MIDLCKVSEVADYMIAKAAKLNEENPVAGYELDFYKLHKLLFFAQGWMLEKYDHPLFCDGTILRSENGPYFHALVRDYYSKWKDQSITEPVEEPVPFPSFITEVLDEVVTMLGNMSRDKLSSYTKELLEQFSKYDSENRERNIIRENDTRNYFQSNNILLELI
ncbi:MAG: Panacea domain-containing protein [Oscillospiraceae bacterium]|nr:Panacea domain-containing protein [Oscillospiraceae bacterium]